MNRKSNILAALMFAVDFFSALFKELKKRNVTEEQIFNSLKPKNNLIPRMAEAIADIVVNARVLLKEFFSSQGPVRFVFGDNFKKWILANEFDYVLRHGNLQRNDLSRPMTDEEIIKEFKIRPYESVSDLLSEICALVIQHPSSESVGLLNNGYANIFYLIVKDVGTVVVFAERDSGGWHLSATRFGRTWSARRRVFSRS